MTLTIELPDDVAEWLNREAQEHGITTAALAAETLAVRFAIAKGSNPRLRLTDFVGAGVADRLAREAAGDFRNGGQIVRDMRDKEWAGRS